MTKTNSTADFFSRYLKNRLYGRKLTALISAALGLLSFFMYSIVMLNMGKIDETDVDKVYDASRLSGNLYMLVTVMFIAAAVLTVYAAFESFDFYLKPHYTDMYGSLPINHKYRFFADLISGYVTSVLPFSVFTLLSIPITASFAKNQGGEIYTELYGYSVLTLILGLTFLYALSVLAASITGRKLSAWACAAIFSLGAAFLACGCAVFTAACITGFKDEALAGNMCSLTPSIHILKNTLDSIVNYQPFKIDHDVLTITDGILNTSASKAVNVICWIIETAAFIIAAYFLTKHRKAERTGGAFAYKYCYHTVLAIAILTVFSVTATFFYSAGAISYNMWDMLIIAVIISAVIFAAFEISMRRGWKNFGKSSAFFGITCGVIIIGAAAARYTGVFGLREILPQVDEIESVKLQDMEFTDEEDIEKFRENHLTLLKKYGNALSTGNIEIEYKLKDGKTFTRSYQSYRDELQLLPVGLKGYKEQFLNALDNGGWIRDGYVTLKGVFGGARIKTEKFGDFVDVFLDEVNENIGNGKIIGNAGLGLSPDNDGRFARLDIYDSYTKTIEFAKNQDNLIAPENDDEIMCYHLMCSRALFDYRTENVVSFYTDIQKKDLSDEKARELISLMQEYEGSKPADSSDTLWVTCGDEVTNLYVTEENERRFKELALDFINDKLMAQADEIQTAPN